MRHTSTCDGLNGPDGIAVMPGEVVCYGECWADYARTALGAIAGMSSENPAQGLALARTVAAITLAMIQEAVPENEEPAMCPCGKHYVGATCPA